MPRPPSACPCGRAPNGPLCLALLGGLLAGPLAAQDALEELSAALAAERAARLSLAAELEAERTARQLLEQRLAALEARLVADAPDDLESQLQALIDGDALAAAPARTIFPSATNPSIGVFMDAVIEGGNTSETLDEDGDRFSLRETELDLRLAVSPWAEAALVITMEEEAGAIDTTVEEGYADLGLGGLLDNDSDATLRLGRFRLPFGHDNVLHTHDLLQVDRPLALQHLLATEGLAGDGLSLTLPLGFAEDEEGLARTHTVRLSLVNGDALAGEETPLAGLAESAGLTLSSDAPLFAARWSRHAELDQRSDLEVGLSVLKNVGSQAVETSSGTLVEVGVAGADVTWRSRDDETGVGSWLVTGEILRADYDFGAPAGGGFPEGSDLAGGWWLSVQRQVDTATYAGLRLGETDLPGTGESMRAITPYVSYYPDEFFRVRLQGQHLELDGTTDDTAQRVLLQCTWNFGAHRPHPYWVNR